MANQTMIVHANMFWYFRLWSKFNSRSTSLYRHYVYVYQTMQGNCGM